MWLAPKLIAHLHVSIFARHHDHFHQLSPVTHSYFCDNEQVKNSFHFRFDVTIYVLDDDDAAQYGLAVLSKIHFVDSFL